MSTASPWGRALDRILESEDLLYCIARWTPSRADLRSLCLVSRWWNQTFSQFLYAHIVFHDGNAHILRDTVLLCAFLSNPRVGRAKSLSFNLIEGSWAIGNHREVGRLVDAPGYGRTGDIRSWAGVYNDSLQKIVLKTPSLVKFEWENWPISESLLETLEESCPALRDVVVVYPNLAKFSRTERFYRHGASTFDEVKPKVILPPTPEFQNLRKLYLYEITGNIDTWIGKIATILGKSEHLVELGLSLSAECERQYALEDSTRACLSFFPRLVERFSNQGDEPLKLRVLKLGYGVLLNATHDPRPDGTVEPAQYLADLTNLACLEELYFDNDLDIGCSLSLRTTSGHIAWSTVDSQYLPNLKRFTFTSLSERSRDWLIHHHDPSWVDGLSIGFGTESLGFSYVYPEGTVRRIEPQSVARQLGRLSDRMYFLKDHPNCPNIPLKSSTLLILKPCQRIDFGVLGRCPWIRTLALCLEKQATPQVLRKTMQGGRTNFPDTENLWIRIGMDYPLLDRLDEASHKGNAIRLKDGELVDEQLYLYHFWREKWTEMASIVAESRSCPRKYLKIGHLAWRIVVHSTGTKPSVLEPVDRWDDEAEGPEVFRFNDPVRRDRPF